MKKTMLAICTFIFYSLLAANIQPQSDSNQIVYLNLKLVEDRVSLQDYKVLKGTLKQPRKIAQGNNSILYSVIDQRHATLFEGALPDPTQMAYEYEDEQGQLRTKVVVRDSVNFFVRIPYDPHIEKIDFYKIDRWIFWGLTLMKRKQTMGSIILNLSTKTNGE